MKAFHFFVLGVFDCVSGAAWLSIVNCYHTGRSVYHPLVSALEAISAIARADVFYQICVLENEIILLLPV